MPSADEWYKAAYYDPDTDTYFDFPTQDGSVPTPVFSGTDPNTAVYGGQPVADFDQAGGLSPFGTMAQGGNVREWEETAWDFVNDSPLENRTNRGGSSGSPSNQLSASFRAMAGPAAEDSGLGFRVASVPEPSTIVLGLLGMGIAGLWWRASR